MTKKTQAVTYNSLIDVTDAATTAITANLDCAGSNYATILVSLGAEKNTNAGNSTAIQLEESDDTVVTNFATFDANFNRNVTNSTAGVVAVSNVDLEGRKRYLRLTVTPSTTTNDDVGISAVGLLCKQVLSGTDSDYGDDVING